MKKKNSKQIVIEMFCIIVLCLSGCSLFPDGKNNSWGSVDTGEVETNAEHYAVGQLSDKISINAKVSIPDQAAWKQYTVGVKSYSDEEARNILLYFRDGRSISEDDSHLIEKETDKNYGKWTYSEKYEDGSSASVTPGGLVGFSSSKQLTMQYQAYLQGSSGSMSVNAAEWFPNEELENLPKQNAIDTAVEICNSLGFDVNSTPSKIYALDAEHGNIRKEEDSHLSMDKFGNQLDNEWTYEDEIYYMTFNIKFNGAELTANSLATESGGVKSNEIVVEIGRTGLIFFRAPAKYDILSETGMEGDICTIKEVCDIVASQYYYTVESMGDLSVAEINLAYGVTYSTLSEEIQIKPYWECVVHQTRTVEQKDGQSKDVFNTRTIFIDPVTKAVK